MTNLKTREKLLNALKDASKREITPEQLHNQRISFIMGSLDEDSRVTRAQVQQVLARQEGR